MKNQDIKKWFQDTTLEIKIDSNQKETTRNVLSKKMEERPLPIKQASTFNLCKYQILYMDKKMLGLQMLGGLLGIFFSIILKYLGTEWEQISVFLMIFSGMLGIFSYAGVGRTFSSKIGELSESCFFNVKQMVLLQMILSGVLNLTILLFIICFVSYGWQMSLMHMGLYVLVPLIFSKCCCLAIFLTEIGRKNPYILLGVGLLTSVFHTIIASTPGIYTLTAVSIWGIAFVIGIMVLSLELKALFDGIEKGELLCTI